MRGGHDRAQAPWSAMAARPDKKGRGGGGGGVLHKRVWSRFLYVLASLLPS
jgi:hypothetical protein